MLPQRRPNNVLLGRVAMAVLMLRKAAEETGTGESTIAIESGCMSAELTEDCGTPYASLRQLPAPETIATSDLAAKLAAADAGSIVLPSPALMPAFDPKLSSRGAV